MHGHFQMSCSEHRLKTASVVKEGLQDQGSVKTWLKILAFASQVWINCEFQVNKYTQPCGTLFAKVAEKLQKSQKSDKTAFQKPVSVLYFLGLEFGDYIGLGMNERTSAGLAVLFIKWGSMLEKVKELNSEAWLFSFCESVKHVTSLGWSGQMLEGLKAISISVKSSYQKKLSMCNLLELAAAAAENAALETRKDDVLDKGDAGAHVVGITARAVFQAYNITTL